MKEYTIKVTCEYYETVEANSLEEAIEECQNNPQYDISSLSNFDYFEEGD